MKEPNEPLSLEDHTCYAIYSAGMAIQRAYKPVLDALGLTYPQYLALNLLWRRDEQTVGGLAQQLALESSTLTPLLKRLEGAGLIRRRRNPENERQVVVALTDKGRALQGEAHCIGERLLETSAMTPEELGRLTADVRRLRDQIYDRIGGWAPGGPPDL